MFGSNIFIKFSNPKVVFVHGLIQPSIFLENKIDKPCLILIIIIVIIQMHTLKNAESCFNPNLGQI